MLLLLPSLLHTTWFPSAAPQRAVRGRFGEARPAVSIRHAACLMQEEPAVEKPAAPAPPETYDEAEARGFELYKAGEYERAIRLFELATTLPGAGVDYRRTSSGGMIAPGSTNAPNPRGMERTRFATEEQKAIAQYNIACCCAAMGDTGRTVDVLRGYLEAVAKPLQQLDEMLVDDDLKPVRAELSELRKEYAGRSAPPGLFGLKNPLTGVPLSNPLRAIAEEVGVEWKD